jgi:hypothetical protein
MLGDNMNDLKFTTAGEYMTDDKCDGTCIINAEDECWCGRKWNGEKMCVPMADDNVYYGA